MLDKLLGRKSRYNWGKNSKNELRQIEKRLFEEETFEELAQDEDDRIAEEENKAYQEYLKNHWVNKLITSRGAVR